MPQRFHQISGGGKVCEHITKTTQSKVLSNMKAVILAGGLGTRLSEETVLKPKPMVEIGGKPILWHIMKIYSAHNITDFIICCGYKGYVIKEYFANYYLHQADVTFCLKDNVMKVHQNSSEPWSVTLVNTGEDTMTGGRLKKIKQYVKGEPAFCFTYGDGVGDINISELIDFHFSHGKRATVTATRARGRYGSIKLKNDQLVGNFREKPSENNDWINGGFFVVSPTVIDLVKNDQISWEIEPMSSLAEGEELVAFKHHGFWQPMDTISEKNYLNELWETGKAPWVNW